MSVCDEGCPIKAIWWFVDGCPFADHNEPPGTCDIAPAIRAVAEDKDKVLVAVPKGMMSDKWLQCLTCEFFTPEAGCVTSEDCPYDCPYEPEQSCSTCNIRRGYEESNNWCGISENRPAGDTCTGWEPR